MPIATPEVYAEMLARAKEHSFAFPAINCTSARRASTPRSRASPTPAATASSSSPPAAPNSRSGLGVKDMVTGAVALAEFAHVIAERYPITVALHTDHCPKDKLDTYVRPLLAISAERVAQGRNPLFQSHMWDGSAVPIGENLSIAQELLKQAAAAKIILEVEIGVVGGEEDGVEAEINDKLYTSSEDFEATIDGARRRRARQVPAGRDVRQRARRVQAGQRGAQARGARRGPAGGGRPSWDWPEGAKPFDFVFHGGSGSLKSEIEDSLKYGVVKMNVDTDTQYAFTRPDRRAHVHQLRRRAQDRRRGRQQEGLRPAQST